MRKKNILFIVIFLFLCVCTIFIKSSHFVNKEILPKWYTLYVLALLGWISLFFTVKSIQLKLDKISFIVLIVIVYVLIFSSLSSAFGMSLVFQYSGFLLLFLFFKLIDNQDTGIIYIIIVGTCVIQAMYGILQFSNIINSNKSFAVVGSFDNPAGFAACLSVGFSFCFALLSRKKLLNYIVIIVMLLIGLSIVISQSRAGMIAIFTIISIFLYNKISYKLLGKDKRIEFISVLFISLLLLSTMLFFKKNSATGRLLIWETTLNMIVEKPILGWRNVSFQSQYMLYQADYFKNHPSSLFKPLADNVAHPFNEILLLIFQYGVVGSILLFFLVFTLFRERNEQGFILHLCLVSILIFSCFSYPLRYPFVWLILAFCLARLSNSSTKIYGQYEASISLMHRIAIVVILLPFFHFLIKDVHFEYKWKKTARSSLMGNTESLVGQYEELNTKWNGNPLFLYNYGAELNFIKEYEKSIQILERCETYWNDYDVQMILADNNFNLGRLGVAAKHYESASKMCPNRYVPLHKLHQINIENGNKIEAIDIAQQILDMEIKIPSARVSSIKKEMESYLNDVVESK